MARARVDEIDGVTIRRRTARLERTQGHIRSRPAGRPWTTAEETLLQNMLEAGKTAAEVGLELNRTRQAVYARAQRLYRRRPIRDLGASASLDATMIGSRQVDAEQSTNEDKMADLAKGNRLTQSPLGIFDDSSYAVLASDNAARYQNADPFPHIVLDNFIPVDLARSLSAAFPGPDEISWVVRDNENNRRRYQHDETRIPALLRETLREMNSRQFVLFLETLTGIESLIPDPYFIGGGVHISGRGDFLKIHADFNWHHKLQAHRRLNALLYLSDDWQPEWNGAIEFWNRDMTEVKSSALPIHNRLVVFSTSEHSNHGQREPNLCPPDTYRKVLNLYYYTTHREDEDMSDPHFTLYKPQASEFAMQLGNDYRQSADRDST